MTQNPEIIQISPFQIIGISLRTTNKDGKASQDIGMLWQRFHTDNLISKIVHKEGEEVYSVYTDYDSDYQGEYTCLIGCKVSSLDNIPSNMVARKFHGGNYRKFVASGKLPDAIGKVWRSIWQQDTSLQRAYTADFEVYDARASNFEQGEVDIYIAM